MKLRVRINRNSESTPLSKRKSGEFFPNQKNRHVEAKSRSVLNIDQMTPPQNHRFNNRRRSIAKAGISNFNSFITPLASPKQDNFAVHIRSSSCSSGYHSMKKKHKEAFKRPFRKSLNIGVILEQTARKSVKVGKYRMYHNFKLTNILPPRALAKNYGTFCVFELWQSMAEKQDIYVRDPNYFSRQSHINPEMRSVLLEWMIDVCEAFGLDFETLYLAVDYLDRYLSVVSDVPTHSLQAIGTTALYIASKLHEITPPTLENFIGVTDGACSYCDVLYHESHMLIKLDWHLQPVTSLSWLALFLQIAYTQEKTLKDNPEDYTYKGPLTRMRYMRSFEKTYISKNFLVRGVEVSGNYSIYLQALSVAICHVGSLRHSYGVIAASLLHLYTDLDVFNITGFGYDEINTCTKWLKSAVDAKCVSSAPPDQFCVLRDTTNVARNSQSRLPQKSSRTTRTFSNDKENVPLAV